MIMKSSVKVALALGMAMQGVVLNWICCNHWQGFLTISSLEQQDRETTYPSLLSLQMDVMVPVFERDDRLRLFAAHLGTAVANYYAYNNNQLQRQQQLLQEQEQQEEASTETIMRIHPPTISTFRLLVTRFSQEEKAQSAAFRQELAQLTGLALDRIVLVHGDRFSRARALNLLHEAACHLETCLVTRLDVDMEVRHEFFQHSVETVILRQVPPLDDCNAEFQYNITISTSNATNNNDNNNNSNVPTAYFPIVWSAYNPESVELVEAQLRKDFIKEHGADGIDQRLDEALPEFSEHRGHWRPYGKGMYVIRGSDALQLTYNTTFEGWGGEDVDFYNRTVALPRRILRRTETGLIHTWHAKNCNDGMDVFTAEQIRNCKASVRREEGSRLGQQLMYQKRKVLGAKLAAEHQAKRKAEEDKATAKTSAAPEAPEKKNRVSVVYKQIK